MICPKCNSYNTFVVRTITGDESNRRKRKCKECGNHWYTVESYKLSDIQSNGIFRLDKWELKKHFELQIKSRAKLDALDESIK